MLKVGDRVIQVNKDYGTSKIGWKGIIYSINTDNTYCEVMFETIDYPLMCHVVNIKVAGPKNKPDVSQKEKV